MWQFWKRQAKYVISQDIKTDAVWYIDVNLRDENGISVRGLTFTLEQAIVFSFVGYLDKERVIKTSVTIQENPHFPGHYWALVPRDLKRLSHIKVFHPKITTYTGTLENFNAR